MRQDPANRTRWMAVCAADGLLAAAWGLMGLRAWQAWTGTRALDMFLLFLTNSLFAALFALRRRRAVVSEDLRHWIATGATVLLSFCFRPGDLPVPAWMAAASKFGMAVGMVFVLMAVSSLGRSFGLVPANRGVKSSGLYRLVRHPLYAAELLVYVSFLAGNPSWRNGLVSCGILAGLAYRAAAEEGFLSHDEEYCRYLGTVRYRFIPGLY